MNADKVTFQIGQVVSLVINPNVTGMITGITFRQSGVTYEVTWDDFEERAHTECELTADKFQTNKK